MKVKEQQQNAHTFELFKQNSPYVGESLYSLIFQRNQQYIGVSREKIAIRNLKKIFGATFKLTPRIGFQAMSLRHLSAETGLSMGGLYSTIISKENIPIMVKDVVTVACETVIEDARKNTDPAVALEALVKGYLYASTLLQPWFYFLYFETRSLPPAQQDESKNIERTQVAELERLITQVRTKSSSSHATEFVATMALALIQERYLKPWKYKYGNQSVDEYADDSLQLIFRSVCRDERQPCKPA